MKKVKNVLNVMVQYDGTHITGPIENLWDYLEQQMKHEIDTHKV